MTDATRRSEIECIALDVVFDEVETSTQRKLREQEPEDDEQVG